MDYLEQLKEDFTKKEEARDVVINIAKTSGLIIRTPEEEKKFKANLEDDLIGSKTREIAERIEKDTLEITGIEKHQDEKYYNHNKRVLQDLVNENNSLKSKMESFKGSDNVKIDESIKKELDELKSVNKKLIEEKNTAIEKFKADGEVYKKNSEFNLIASSLKFDEAYDESIQKILLNNAKEKVFGLPSEYREDSLIFLDESGSALRNESKNLDPFTMGDLIKKELDQYLFKGEKKEGLGSKPIDRDDDKKFMPDTVRSKVQLTDYLKTELGLKVGTEEFQKQFDELGKELPLR